jgi:outer membrane protein assembly factor BamA
MAYINRNNRWNWGVFTEHVPLLSGTVRAGTAVVDGQPVYVETTDLDRQTYTTLGGMVAYPFSRALRLEFSASGQRIGFSRERERLIFDGFTGNVLLRDVEDLEGEPALTLAQASAALVRDTTAFGATGPILGQRFRFEVAPTAGDLSFTHMTADFRQYAMPVRPLTLAARLLHVGRYGGGSEDQRLLPLFLGYPTLVRGYDVNSFEPNECVPDVNGSCPAFDRLVGSRIAVVNAEARLPLFGFGGNIAYGPIPTELFAFFDAGVAWTRTLDPSFGGSGGDREWVRSAGVGARVNLFGYAIGEFNVARPLDRPGRGGWMFVFNLRPGF